MSVDKIMSTFTKTITKLNKVAALESKQAEVKTELIKELKTQCQAHADESLRAQNIAGKLMAIIE